MRPDQFTREFHRPLYCSGCEEAISGTYFRVGLWVIGDPQWATGGRPLCPSCHCEALATATTAAGAERLALRDLR